MKKILAVILALILAFSLAACANNSGSPGSDAPASSPSESAPAPSASSDSPAQAPASVAPTVGTVNDDVDHFAREKYKIVFAHFDNRTLEQEAFESLQLVADRFNYEVTRMSGDSDEETYINNLQTLVDRGGIDGVLVFTTTTIKNAVLEIMNNSGIPYVVMFTPLEDDQGRCVAPVSGLQQYNTGYAAMEWLTLHYKDYWGDIDTSDFGMIGVDFSVIPVMHERIEGLQDAFLKAFPDNEDNVFYFDGYTAPTGNRMESGYDATTQIVNANPQIKYWMVCGANEDLSQGMARAAEDLGYDEKTMLVTSVGTSVFQHEWESGYTGSWVSTIAIYTPGHTTPGALGLIALIDGRATPETLWPQYRRAGDFCSIWEAEFKPVTFAELYDYLEEMRVVYGW